VRNTRPRASPQPSAETSDETSDESGQAADATGRRRPK